MRRPRQGPGVLFLFLALAMGQAPAGAACYFDKESFAVGRPDLVTRACYLFSHATTAAAASSSGVSSDNQARKDFLQEEYYALIGQGQIRGIPKDTPAFDCGRSLEAHVLDPERARLLHGRLPSYYCLGYFMEYIQVRPAGMRTCMWVPVGVLRCDE